MDINRKKTAKIILILSIVVIIVGYFLWTILIPIQDIEIMSDAELLRAQKELALNYPLGRLLLYLGFTGFILSLGYLVIGKIKDIISRSRRKKDDNI